MTRRAVWCAVPEVEGRPKDEPPLKINIDEMQKYIDAHPVP